MKMSRRQSLRHLAGAGVGAAAVWHTSAHAAVFLELEQAQKLLAPQASNFVPVPLVLDASKLAELAAASQTRVPRGYTPRCFEAMAGSQRIGWVLADKAIGKYELIDFAAGFAADASMTGLEVMVYRESHGAEIRNAAWRRQFAGKQGPAQLRFGDDIRNISGATLSCQHVTEAAQRLSVIAQWLRQAAH